MSICVGVNPDDLHRLRPVIVPHSVVYESWVLIRLDLCSADDGR